MVERVLQFALHCCVDASNFDLSDDAKLIPVNVNESILRQEHRASRGHPHSARKECEHEEFRSVADSNHQTS